MIDLLDQLAQILGEERVSLADFLQILEAGFAKAKIALIPPGQDQVLVGDMERTRLQDIRALFFMGVNEGHIPRNTSQGGILTEGDRAFFASEGIELAPDPREQINIQRFYLYLNLTRPRDILQLSCCTTSGKGEAVTPAYLIGTIMSLFPLLEIKNAEKERLSSLPEEPLAAVPDFLRMLSMYSREDPDPLFGELYSWYLSEPAYTGPGSLRSFRCSGKEQTGSRERPPLLCTEKSKRAVRPGWRGSHPAPLRIFSGTGCGCRSGSGMNSDLRIWGP